MFKIKKYIWKFNYAIYAHLRDFILFVGLWKHSARQNFPIGFVKDGVKTDTIINILKTNRFENSICSWIDDNEILSMRRLDDKRQHHVRLFSDGELRGHYEFSPEGAPIKHLLGIGFQQSKQYFEDIFNKVLK
jgi:hypothetical protein